jgi:hypothetical protein
MEANVNAKRLAACTALLTGLSCAPAAALDAFKIEGAAFLDDEACAAGLEAEGCVLTFSITGKAAKTLYEGMKAKPQKEECTGGLQKVEDSGLNCINNSDTEYKCDFGYHFKERAFGGSGMDC